MNKGIVVIFLIVTALLNACSKAEKSEPATKKNNYNNTSPCFGSWVRFIEDTLPTQNDPDNAPAIGSEQWQIAIEARLGVVNQTDRPKLNDRAWCHYIDTALIEEMEDPDGLVNATRTSENTDPSFMCDKVVKGSAEALICKSPELSTLDKNLSIAFMSAHKIKTEDDRPEFVLAHQDWKKGLDACLPQQNAYACMQDLYTHRIARLRAQFWLAPYEGPFVLNCTQSTEANSKITFFKTSIPTLLVKFTDIEHLMIADPNTDGAQYSGEQGSLRVEGDQVIINLTDAAEPMLCKKGALTSTSD